MLLLGALALGGCMRIYPDPELPDVDVVWFEGDCRDGTGDVVLTLTSLESDATRAIQLPCMDYGYTFADVPRERFNMRGELYTANGEVFSRWNEEVDLRHGADKEVYLLFGGGANFRVSWEFDMGATCESIGAVIMSIDFLAVDYSLYARCQDTPFFGFPGNGTHSVQLRALTEEGEALAISPVSPEFTLMSFDQLVDIGTMILTPCDGVCPEP